MKREVCSAENVPVDIQKIIPIQRRTGSQYLMNLLFNGSPIYFPLKRGGRFSRKAFAASMWSSVSESSDNWEEM